MAKRSRESFQKRAREKARQEKRDAKREKRDLDDSSEADSGPTRAEEDVLMQQFARLSASYENDQISVDDYNEERHRIFVALGLEDDD